MLPTAYYINLAHRPERATLMQQRWHQHVNLTRIEAFDMSKTKQGVRGCFLSHVLAFEQASLFPIPYSLFPPIIMEDDIIPCSDFPSRLNLVFEHLPGNWHVLMLGHSVHHMSQYTHVNAYLHKAHAWVGAGHCYIINPAFYQQYSQLLANHKLHEHNFDVLLNHLQKNYNVYMATPSLCYQYSSYSDNSNMLLDNTKYTEVFFKDKL